MTSHDPNTYIVFYDDEILFEGDFSSCSSYISSIIEEGLNGY